MDSSGTRATTRRSCPSGRTNAKIPTRAGISWACTAAADQIRSTHRNSTALPPHRMMLVPGRPILIDLLLGTLDGRC